MHPISTLHMAGKESSHHNHQSNVNTASQATSGSRSSPVSIKSAQSPSSRHSTQSREHQLDSFLTTTTTLSPSDMPFIPTPRKALPRKPDAPTRDLPSYNHAAISAWSDLYQNGRTCSQISQTLGRLSESERLAGRRLNRRKEKFLSNSQMSYQSDAHGLYPLNRERSERGSQPCDHVLSW